MNGGGGDVRGPDVDEEAAGAPRSEGSAHGRFGEVEGRNVEIFENDFHCFFAVLG